MTDPGGTFQHMPEGQFAYFHFTGGRFDAGEGMPLDAIGDLALYRELVVEVARHLWHTGHPTRQRAPRRFAAKLDLRLERVDGGSVTPFIGRREQESSLIDDYFDESRDLITAAVGRVGARRSLPRAFPRSQVTRLSRFGATLTAGERLDFGHPDETERRAHLDIGVSELLKQIAVTLSSEQPETRLRGHIVEMDTDLETFQLRTTDGRRLGGAVYFSDDADRIREWLVIDEDDKVLVEVVGPALVDAEGAVLRFDGAVTVRAVPLAGILSIFDAVAQVAEEAELSATAIPIPVDLLRSLNERSEALAEFHPRVGIMGVEHGLRIEWMAGEVDRSVEIDLRDNTIFMHEYDAESDIDWEWQGSVSDEGWVQFDRFVRGQT